MMIEIKCIKVAKVVHFRIQTLNFYHDRLFRLAIISFTTSLFIVFWLKCSVKKANK